MTRILVAGGLKDPNVHAVLNAAEDADIETVSLLIGDDRNPSIHWDLNTDELWLDGKLLKITGAFVRRDVFHTGSSDADYRALAWYTTLTAWLGAHLQIKILNREYLNRYTNKLLALRLAQQVGFLVPSTVITNTVGSLVDNRPLHEHIAKPVTGGGPCQYLDDVLKKTKLRAGVAASPAIVQQKLLGPDVRIYGINGKYFGFRLHSDRLDYREAQHCHIEPLKCLPPTIVKSLRLLMKSMRLTWGAADFKIHPDTKELTFLEINSDPMFSKFNQNNSGRLTKSILRFLTKS